MDTIDYAPSGNRPGTSMEPTGSVRPGFPMFDERYYPDRLRGSDRERLTCGACNGQGTRGRHQQIGAGDCAWCSGRGWNYAAPSMTRQ
jgi:hypothetical protein